MVYGVQLHETHIIRKLYSSERAADDVLPLLVLLSDGRANVTLDGSGESDLQATLGADSVPTKEVREVAALVDEQHVPSLVIDTESGFIQLGLAQPIAEAMGARYLKLEDLQVGNLTSAVRSELPVVPEGRTLDYDRLADRLSLT